MSVLATEVGTSSFSVVVPVFNSSSYLASTIEAIVQVFEKSGRRLELVLVNDGSSDPSWQIIVEKAEIRQRHLFVSMQFLFSPSSWQLLPGCYCPG